MEIMNTWFQQSLCGLYTWKIPGDISRNQKDYVMINQRFRNCVKQARTYSGADINSDHNPVTFWFKVNDKGKPYGMEINMKKTKSMVASKKQETPKVSISLEGTAIEQVQTMVYLGSITTEDGKSEVKIKRRIEIARNAFNNMKSVLSSRNIITNTRMRLTKCYVWSTLLYEC